eukprot:CAMPEP_0205850472 /NCGR_PEP_ID=MMETSP1019-20131125/133389_1 /ASSEMBLY_ACC=CAM_ASM_000403 /TAXON_ID=46462 /ORGANISM="Anophryoides haemophila, Strain AH6" /LENGTH=84 /DNA_ID=CAMNT_0053211339 /DNA_START=84 /DNA_END=339 /DNA_ORIENTATION=-
MADNNLNKPLNKPNNKENNLKDNSDNKDKPEEDPKEVNKEEDLKKKNGPLPPNSEDSSNLIESLLLKKSSDGLCLLKNLKSSTS